MMIIIGIIGCVLAVYLYLLKPRLTKQEDLKKYKGKYYAHRGLHNNQGDVPENSLPAFANAIEGGYGIELDVQLTKDEVLVVFHDEQLERMCGQKGRVSDYTYNELREFSLLETDSCIPTLENVLNGVDATVPLIIEIKMYKTDTRVCEVLSDILENYHGDYCIESFNPLAVRWYKLNKPEIIRGQLSSALNQESGSKSLVFFMVEHLLTNIFTRPDFIAYNCKFKKRLGRKVCKNIFRCFGVTWTVKSQEELDNVRRDFDVFIFEGFIPEQINMK